MAGVGFELKKVFRDNRGLIGSLKGYSVTAVVTEGPMILTIVMLASLRFLILPGSGDFSVYPHLCADFLPDLFQYRTHVFGPLYIRLYL